MSTLTGTKISDTYVGLLKTLDTTPLSDLPKEISDGLGTGSGVKLDNAGNLDVTNTVAFGSLKDTSEDITITKFVDEADGIENNDDDTSIPTSAAVKDYVDDYITAQDLDFSGNTGTGDVDLDSEVFTITGSNGITTTALDNTLDIDGSTLQTAINTNITDISTNTGNITTNATNIATNETDIATNVTDISTNATNISSNDTDIATNQSAIATNTTDIGANATAISTNATNIATNSTNISTNALNISSNDTDIATNVTNIATNTATGATNASNIATNTTAIGVNTTAIATNSTDILANATSIATNVTDIGANATAIATNVTDIAANTTAIATNTTDIATNVTNISTNTTGIATNVTNIATNATDIATNATAIATNTTDIATNATAIATNTTDIATNVTNIATNTAEILNKVDKSGDTMTGTLNVSLETERDAIRITSETGEARVKLQDANIIYKDSHTGIGSVNGYSSTNVNINGSGYLGIKQRNPLAPMHVKKNGEAIRLESSGDNVCSIDFTQGTNKRGHIEFQNSNDTLDIKTTNPTGEQSKIKFSTAYGVGQSATEALRIQNIGANKQIAINNTLSNVPSSRELYVNGSIEVTGQDKNLFVGDIGCNGQVEAGSLKIKGLNGAPSSSTGTGKLGEIRFTAGYIYLCVGTDLWKRVALENF